MQAFTLREMAASEQIHWHSEGDKLVSSIGSIVPRGNLVDLFPGGPLLGRTQACVIGLYNVEAAVIWFEEVCANFELGFQIDHPVAA